MGSTKPTMRRCIKIDKEDGHYVKEKDIPIIRGPISPNPHVRFFFIKDPNGIEVQLVENK